MRKFLNFCVPAILRIIAVIAVIGVSISLAADPVAGVLGGFIFWIIYFVFQCRTMENSTKSSFLESVFEFLSHKGLYVSSFISAIGLLYGSFVFFTGATKGSTDPTIILAISLVVYPIITHLFVFREWLLQANAATRILRAERSNTGCLSYWLRSGRHL